MRVEPGSRDALPATSRYEVLLKIAAGGMATVYAGRLRAAGGVTRLFAIKRAHAHLTGDPIFRRMFVTEARLASKIHHPNVVAVQDVEELDDELLLVMDYVEGVALANLDVTELPPLARIRAATRIVLDAASGLEAAHELRGDDGRRLGIVHRDVSPHNVLVGVDGIGRLTDFGIAKTTSLSRSGASAVAGNLTATGGLKGKLGYMAPEYVDTAVADQRSDVFSLGVVFWEALTGTRLFRAPTEFELMKVVLAAEVAPPSTAGGSEIAPLDGVVLRALARDPRARFPTALAFLEALEHAARQADLVATHREVGGIVRRLAADVLEARQSVVRSLEAEGLVSTEMSVATVDYAEPDHTQTLDPSNEATLELPPAAPPAPPPRSALVARSTPPLLPASIPPSRSPGPLDPAARAAGSKNRARGRATDRLAIAAIAAIAVVGVWFGARRLRVADPPLVEPASSSPPVFPPPAPLSATLPPSAPIVPATAPRPSVAEPPAGVTPAASVTGKPPRRPAGRPKASGDDPVAPAHAPKNPYRDAPRSTGQP